MPRVRRGAQPHRPALPGVQGPQDGPGLFNAAAPLARQIRGDAAGREGPVAQAAQEDRQAQTGRGEGRRSWPRPWNPPGKGNIGMPYTIRARGLSSRSLGGEGR